MIAKELESDIGTAILNHHQLDISCSSSIDTFKKYIESNYGGFDVLVNNAGIVLGLGPPTAGISSNKGKVSLFSIIERLFARYITDQQVSSAIKGPLKKSIIRTQ